MTPLSEHLPDKEYRIGMLTSGWDGEAKIWAEQQAGFMTELRRQLYKNPKLHLDENDLWTALAPAVSEEWKKLKTAFEKAEAEMKDMLSPQKRPLGLIGAALASDETNRVKTDHAEKLAAFTLHDEALRYDGMVHLVLREMILRQDAVDKSMELSRQAKMTAQFMDAVLAPDTQHKKKTGIVKKVSQKIFGRQKSTA